MTHKKCFYDAEKFIVHKGDTTIIGKIQETDPNKIITIETTPETEPDPDGWEPM